jgi:hypothetical protein
MKDSPLGAIGMFIVSLQRLVLPKYASKTVAAGALKVGFNVVSFNVLLLSVLIGSLFSGHLAKTGVFAYFDSYEGARGTFFKGMFPAMHEGKAWGFTLAEIPPLNGKVILVTGANTGLGFWTARCSPPSLDAMSHEPRSVAGDAWRLGLAPNLAAEVVDHVVAAFFPASSFPPHGVALTHRRPAWLTHGSKARVPLDELGAQTNKRRASISKQTHRAMRKASNPDRAPSNRAGNSALQSLRRSPRRIGMQLTRALTVLVSIVPTERGAPLFSHSGLLGAATSPAPRRPLSSAAAPHPSATRPCRRSRRRIRLPRRCRCC